MYYIYILRCNDDSFYTGWTTDIKRRVLHHNEGKGAKYTRSRLPVQVVYSEKFSTKEAAMQREYEIKQLSRAEKRILIQSV